MMASSSSSSNPRNNKHDVFLSFSGEDTRDNFTSHLYSALCQKGIETFIDDQLNRGDEISQSLLDTIEASSISIIIFSEKYASSGWCLDELSKVLDCRKVYAQIVIPVFYRVDPSHVRKQIGSFGVSFSKLKEKFPEKMQRWRSALTEAANLSGFDSFVIRNESELIKKVVNDILEKLPKVVPCDSKNELVGVESRVEEIQSLLGAAPLLGIWGIGGIGKTTIARVIFNRISRNFKGSCFLENIREESQKAGGLAFLQQKLLSEVLKDVNVIPHIDLNFRRLSCRKVLIVLDDVTCLNQIESLVGSLDRLLPESRILITTRNKQVLRNCHINQIYEMKGLGDDHALELFIRHAFRQNLVDVDYKELSDKVINYAQGVPLALKILGCYLFERKKEVWENAIKKLKNFLHQNILDVLKISYDDLDNDEKNIFLDVACFFKGEDIYLVKKFFEASGFYPEIGISILVDKALIAINSYNKITMHDLLQELGREIVRQESTNPGNRTRLWHHEDIYEVLAYNRGTEAIEGMCLDMSKVKEIYLNSDTFTKMRKLRFLKFYISTHKGENKCKVSNFRSPIFAEIRYFHWHGYPLKSLPSNIDPEKLVLLEMPHSNIEQLWSGNQHYGKLKRKIIAACNTITKSPNPSLIPHLNKLVSLKLSGCKSLKSLPAEMFHFEFLKELDLLGCSKLKRLPEMSSAVNIEEVILNGTAIEELPSSIDCISGLSILDVQNCKKLKSLPSNLCKLTCLRALILNGCSKLQRLPDELGNLEALGYLHAEGTGIREVPSSIVRLNNVRKLDFKGTKGLSLPMTLSLGGALRGLWCLDLADCGITELPENLGMLTSLIYLYLDKNNFGRIPESIIQLSTLLYIRLSHCERLQSLPELPCCLIELDAHHCTALESLSGLFSSNEPYHPCIDLSDNYKMDQNVTRGILQDALQKFKHMATERWKRVRKKIPFSGSKGYILLPGSEIPEWFSFKSEGSSMTLEMTPDFFNKNRVLGFAFSAIVGFGDHQDVRKARFKLFWEIKVKPKDCDSHVIQRSLAIIRYVESDHLLLGDDFFDDKDFFTFWENNWVPEAIQFYFKEEPGYEILEYCLVKKCGIHLLYVPDSTDSTEGEGPHP
ncbi:Disease resistance-like protein DSC1 [Citrus sinensis]|uniref:disease resistance-like protein DSC1 isoform X1 n=1 Tax=Citrus sinensis TaxID=2711 RepID=UPI0021974F39|nr:disease resistance-like protein DSC1 isoform X1 [Citrus sinensis]KAH9725548.1 Disease resistance-like protein DSC1 [Citrus sinensis]